MEACEKRYAWMKTEQLMAATTSRGKRMEKEVPETAKRRSRFVFSDDATLAYEYGSRTRALLFSIL
jgi:hypothetical protein